MLLEHLILCSDWDRNIIGMACTCVFTQYATACLSEALEAYVAAAALAPSKNTIAVELYALTHVILVEWNAPPCKHTICDLRCSFGQGAQHSTVDQTLQCSKRDWKIGAISKNGFSSMEQRTCLRHTQQPLL